MPTTSGPGRFHRWRSGLAWLILVAVGFAVAQLVVVPLDTFLSWDEALYASQFSTTVPAMGMSAHRALGVPLLLAPVTAMTSSIPAVRAYLVAATCVGLVLAFRPWLRVGGRSAALAALLFAGSEVALENAPQALPSVPAALAAVAGVGFFLRATGPGRARGAEAGVAVAFAVLSLTRPTDAVFVSVPLLVAAVVVPRWRRLVPMAAVVVGLLVGGVVWLVEAWVRYDGPFSRLAAMRRITAAGTTEPVAFQWLADLRAYVAASPLPAALVIAGCVVAAAAVTAAAVRMLRTVPRSRTWALPVVAALGAALPYYLLLSFTSTRYLLPAYGLLTPVLATALVGVARIRPGALGRVAGGVVAALVVAFVAAQVPMARADMAPVAAARQEREGYAARLSALGVVPPCVVSGSFAPQVAYALRCSAGDIESAVADDTTEHAANRRDVLRAHAENAQLVVVWRSSRRPAWLADWTRVRISRRTDTFAYFLRAPS